MAYMSTSATLQTSIRIRIILILIFSVIVTSLRGLASNAVQNATTLLNFNYILYGTVLLCSLMPFRRVWTIVIVLHFMAGVLGLVATLLGSISTGRCLSAGNAGCVTSAPGSIVILILAAIIVLLDFYQAWTAYLILRYPTFISSVPQRVRILFSWAFPFAWLVNIYLLADSKWSALVATHMIVDPTIIFMADTGEVALLIGLAIIAVCTDLIALFALSFEGVVLQAVVVQAVLTLSGIALLLFSGTTQTRTAIKEKTNGPTLFPGKEGLAAPGIHKRKLKSEHTRISF